MTAASQLPAAVSEAVQQAQQPSRGTIRVKTSVLRQAKKNNPEAIRSMFRQFIPDDEEIYLVHYLGIKGVFGIGASSFGCLTQRRVADITVGFFGEVTYEDAFVETIKSSAIYQPSRLSLFIMSTFTILIALVTVAFIFTNLWWMGPFQKLLLTLLTAGLLFFAHTLLVRIYYGIVKCGIRFFVYQGITVYVYTNRRLLKRANALCRVLALQRENRLGQIDPNPAG